MTNSENSPSGIAYPDDLALLKRVYDRICEERGIRAGSAEAEQLAGAVLFAKGPSRTACDTAALAFLCAVATYATKQSAR
ncbi:hypothetical protein [Mesorhizobium sp. M0910]|uniref:hypothetical protein n=1 Tax=Mesorhizobium sp. M0910 TaxID=2957025 RepID=UPI003335FF38